MKRKHERQKRAFSLKKEKLREAVYEYVKSEIIRVCARHKWDFRSLYFTCVTKGDRYVSHREAKALIALVFWADDLIGFPDCAYVDGVWIPNPR